MDDYYADGHHITADSISDAFDACIALYLHRPEVIRLWITEDQDELNRITA